MNESPLLEGRALSCIRDQRILFSGLDIQLEPAKLLHVQGVNGAGKTSLLRILCGLLLPQAGSVFWRERDIRRSRSEYHQELLYIGHSPGLKEELTPLENLQFYQSLGQHSGGPQSGDVEQALEQVGLLGFEDVPVRTLSAGQRRRVALARLWLSQALLWILDEPLTALDRDGRTHLEQRLAQHIDQGGCIVLTSHQTLQLSGVTHLRLQ